MSEGVHLADGEHIADGGDVAIILGYTLALRPRVNEGDQVFCLQGTYTALADVPTDAQVCPGNLPSGGWMNHVFLSAAVAHSNEESEFGGLSLLVRNAEHDALYRLRVLSESVGLNDEGTLGNASITFEYEPVP